jgi:hypothetical protein
MKSLNSYTGRMALERVSLKVTERNAASTRHIRLELTLPAKGFPPGTTFEYAYYAGQAPLFKTIGKAEQLWFTGEVEEEVVVEERNVVYQMGD